MSHARLMSTVEWWVLGSALFFTLLAGLLWRTPNAIGSAAAGGLLAVLNLLVLRRTVAGFFDGSSPAKQAALSVILFLKMGVLLAAIWASVALLGFSPVGVGLGVSAIVVGVVGGTLQTPRQRMEPKEEGSR